MPLFMSIHGNPDYIYFNPEVNVATIFVGFLGLVSLMRFAIDVRMSFIYYCKNRHQPRMHRHLFDSFVMMDGANFLFSLTDNLAFRIPSTGFITAWCASVEPNKWLVLIYAFQLVSAYWTLFFTTQFAVVRVGILFFPMNHKEVLRRFIYIFSTIAIIFPICIVTFIMFPAKGYCRQWISPYPFGAVFISFTGTTLNIRNDLVYFSLTFLTPSLICGLNIFLAYLLKKHRKSPNNNSRTSTALEENSLTYTTVAMTAPFIVHGIMNVVSTVYPETSSFVVILRTPVTELGQLAVPVVFSLSNEMFNSRKRSVARNAVTPVVPSNMNT